MNKATDTQEPQWVDVCHIDDIQEGTGVCAKVNNQHVAIFRPRDNDEVFAISNIDPFAAASVLSRGFICEHKDELWVASPLKKQRLNLITGECFENEDVNIPSFQSKVDDQRIFVAA
jgi:nitrite reductase (NADH) small subunit